MANTEISSTCDFARSYLRFRSDRTLKKTITSTQKTTTTLNNVRMPLDCLTTIRRGEKFDQFGLGGSCKTERVFVEGDIWTMPNGDMCAVYGGDPPRFMIISRYDRVGKGVMLNPPSLGEKPDRQCVDPTEAFDSVALDLSRCLARRLDSLESALQAFAGRGEVVGRTEFRSGEAEILVEYPIRVVNFSERHGYFQVDTGPLLFFGDPTGPNLIERLHLAYVAHLGGPWAEFLVCRPTPLEGLPVQVHHFSESRRVDASNSLWLLERQLS